MFAHLGNAEGYSIQGEMIPASFRHPFDRLELTIGA